jgi:hypothetical protein
MTPVILLLCIDYIHPKGAQRWKIWRFILTISMFSMYPLLKRDNLIIPYVSLMVLWEYLLWSPSHGKPRTLEVVQTILTSVSLIQFSFSNFI